MEFLPPTSPLEGLHFGSGLCSVQLRALHFWLWGLTTTPEDRLHSGRGGVIAGGLRQATVAGGLRKATYEAFGAGDGFGPIAEARLHWGACVAAPNHQVRLITSVWLGELAKRR